VQSLWLANERGTERGDKECADVNRAGERQRYDFISGRVDCPVIYFDDYDVLL
jgi:hypothetical protein